MHASKHISSPVSLCIWFLRLDYQHETMIKDLSILYSIQSG